MREKLWRALWHPRLHQVLFTICLCSVLWLALTPGHPADVLFIDKLYHIAAFMALTVLAMLGWSMLGEKRIFLSMLALGILIEVLQTFVGRDADMADVIADLVGVMLAICLVDWLRGLLAAK